MIRGMCMTGVGYCRSIILGATGTLIIADKFEGTKSDVLGQD